MTLADFNALVREQDLMLLVDREAAIAALPALLPNDGAPRQAAFDFLRHFLAARGPLTGTAADRPVEVATLFGVAGASLQVEGAPLGIPGPGPSDAAPQDRTRS